MRRSGLWWVFVLVLASLQVAALATRNLVVLALALMMIGLTAIGLAVLATDRKRRSGVGLVGSRTSSIPPTARRWLFAVGGVGILALGVRALIDALVE